MLVLLRVVRLARIGVGPRALGLRTIRTALLDGVWISFRRRVSVNSILSRTHERGGGRFVSLAYKINVFFCLFCPILWTYRRVPADTGL